MAQLIDPNLPDPKVTVPETASTPFDAAPNKFLQSKWSQMFGRNEGQQFEQTGTLLSAPGGITIELESIQNIQDIETLATGVLDATPDTDHTANGPTTNTLSAGYSSAVGDLVYYSPVDLEWLPADADAEATAGGVLLAIALEAKTDGQAMNVALPGSFVRDDTWNWTPGQELFVSTTAGGITDTAPSASADIVRVVGYAISADIIYFNPSGAWVEIA